MAAAKFPELIEVVVGPDGHGRVLRIDGVDFPFAIAPSITIDLDRAAGIQTITIEMIADRVRIIEEN